MTRARLPNRRECHTETLVVNGHDVEVCVGFDPKTGAPREVFMNSGKEGSEFVVLMADAAILISIALQHGVSASALKKSMNRLPPTAPAPGSFEQLGIGLEPASPIGAALDLLCSLERPTPALEPKLERVACKGAKDYDHT